MLVDLRSDTVTQPTQEMREAMYRAEVGDDVYDEDPTIHRLQELAAEMAGKEAALFVPTGTMGNAIAVLTHTGRGQAVMVGDESHIYHYEAGGASTLGGSPMYVVPTHTSGMLDLERVRDGIAGLADPHVAPTGLICVENTHNRCGGTVLTVEQLASLADLAHAHNIPVHMDGARLFNAAVALDQPVRELARPVDSLMFCLSKGLSAPVGSLLVGSKDFIRRALRTRKLLGGGMRQAGFLAAAGIVALEQMVERLADDHARCKRLALALADMPQVEVSPEKTVTNMVIFRLRDQQGAALDATETQRFIQAAREQGVLMGQSGAGRVRAVTHYGIEDEHIEAAIQGIRLALRDSKIAKID
ncbi:threonine aldolase [Ktedonobacter sp. SOSP1-52]|uniref:low-specificity L-threonine aldolase n=1 Tax=Ktedonobacter sp. SOSP1-52 TaxID=2778366 RepID=UPI0019166EA4|nr:low-specificity L-threonine aldolase [Ktedonobacter sp. SOSP1-52]GHO64802.1 threonine aldolase [Ktedonobacter sp. SOSP1-52]